MAVSSTTSAGSSHYGIKSAFDSSGRWRSPLSLPADLEAAAREPAMDSAGAAIGPAGEADGPERCDAAIDRSGDTSGDTSEARVRARASSANELEQGPRVTGKAVAREQLLAELAADAAPRGLRIAWDLLGNREEAEDAVQEALARACEQCHRIREPKAIRAWFYRVLTNLCMRALRRRRVRRLFFGAQKNADAERPDTAQQPSPDRHLSHTREVTQLYRALDDLPAKQRTALLLRYGHELTVAEIADMLAVRPATVKTHLVRGLRRLRKTMERNQ